MSVQAIITYAVYIIVGVLTVLGNHFLGVPDSAAMSIVLSFVFGHLLGLQMPAPQLAEQQVPPQQNQKGSI